MFVKDGWQYLSPAHKSPPLSSPVSARDLTLFRIFVPIVGILPYVTMYQAANSDPGFVTPESHERALRAYPYDHVNFRPGVICRTCHLRKPARSKHCSICLCPSDHNVFLSNHV